MNINFNADNIKCSFATKMKTLATNWLCMWSFQNILSHYMRKLEGTAILQLTYERDLIKLILTTFINNEIITKKVKGKFP